MSKWIICVVVSSLLGTFLYGFWYLLSSLLDKRKYITFIYYSLHIVTVFFSVFAFWGMITSIVLTKVPVYSFWGYTNRTIELLAQMIGSVWAVGAVYQLSKYVRYHFLHAKLVRALEVSNERIQRIAEQTCIRMKIMPSIKILTGNVLFTAELSGWKVPYIMLPDFSYTDVQVSGVILHELTHYKNKDRIIRELAMIVHCIHWFNPVIKSLHRSLERWDELYCDYCVCDCGLISKDEYADLLLYMSERMIEKKDAFMMIAFNERGTNMIERMQEIISYKKENKVKRKIIIAMSLVFTLCGVSTALAAGKGTYELYDQWIVNVIEGREEKPQEKEKLQEYKVYLDQMDEEEKKMKIMTSSSGTICASIANSKWTSGGFQASSGQSIAVSVYAEPENVYLKVGIIEPDGWMRYVYNYGDISYTFTLNQTGIYYVFVWNETNDSVSMVGSFSVRTTQKNSVENSEIDLPSIISETEFFMTNINVDTDFVKAMGIDGQIGYVKACDVVGAAAGYVPLYAEDGCTVIGQFKIG